MIGSFSKHCKLNVYHVMQTFKIFNSQQQEVFPIAVN